MIFSMDLDNAQVFVAAAQLNPDGSLATFDAFSDNDFSVQTVDGQTTARLINQSFSIPFDLPATKAGTGMSFSFGQTYSATAKNGGTAAVENIPEPAAFWMLCAGGLGVLLGRRMRWI